MHADFWKRFSQKYLHTFQQRSKWTQTSDNIEPNTLVLIKSKLKPTLQCDLSPVIEIHPGRDGLVKVATVKTANGFYKGRS